MVFPLLCAFSVSAPAQADKHASPPRQQVAGAASRNQLAAYLADFQKHPEDATLRGEIVALAKSMNPAPAIPPLARDTFARAGAQMRTASSADGFKAAARLFEQAAVQAPWYADADLSAATACSQGADFDGARRNLDLYLAAVRAGVGTQNAEDLRREIDSQQARLQFQQALQQFAANPSNTARQQIIKLAKASGTAPDIPAEARGHFVMATVLMNSAEGNPGYEQRAIEEFKAALLAAPWWGDAYKKLATAQTAAGQYYEAIANLNFYQLTQFVPDRKAQDEIYRLMALGQTTADQKEKEQAEEQLRKLREDNRQQERSAVEGRQFTIEGRWYGIPVPNDYFVGDKSKPECDYIITQSSGRWTIKNACSRPSWAIDKIRVDARQISFRLSGHDPAYSFAEVNVTLGLSDDGQTLLGRATAYDKTYTPVSDRSVRWTRRVE